MNILKAVRENMLVPIHPAGWPFIAIFAIAGFILTAMAEVLFFPSLILTLWCVYFFRNPVRVTPMREGLVVAPADGRVLCVEDLPPPPELNLPTGKYTRVAIFMNVFDVHVNRVPMAGKITDKFYFPGKFFNADLDKASEQNERLGLVMKTDYGPSIGFVQIAGLVARRILCDANEGDHFNVGAHYGIIRFGSRVDIWLPKPVKTLICVGQTTIAGETMIADFVKSAKANSTAVSR
ncbi:MAG: phosphatidylserine decarboxylase [Candidatus Puniceispirillales bacterium WSBS_2018_MAG_OTU23]